MGFSAMSSKELNQLGLFPGPDEEESSFLKRVSYCLALPKNERGVFSSIENDYGFSPTWVQIDYSNKGLLPWEGGCTWIFQEDENSPLRTTLQLRKVFETKASYLKLYTKEEILTHELAHVGRAAFEEPKFEEFLAYRTSPNSFRRLFSPLLERAFEAYIFLAFLVIGYLLSSALPSILAIAALLRLRRRHKTFQRAVKHLKTLLGGEAEPFLYRLKDEEIIFCSENEGGAIKKKFANNSYRFQFLRTCYPELTK
jgi:hypothetical protein